MNLKYKLENVKEEFRNRIINGVFEVLSTSVEIENTSYIGSITISIDDVVFKILLSKGGNFICIIQGLDLGRRFDNDNDLKNLYKAFHNNLDRSKEIKILEEKLKQLKS